MMIFIFCVAVQSLLIAGISTSEIYQQQVNQAYLNNMVSELTVNELTDLQSIAHQCPLMGGAAVAHARTIISAYTDEVYDDSEACAIFGIQARRTEITSLSVKVFPNPADMVVNLKWEEKKEGTGVVVLLNAVGIEVLEQVIKFNEHWASINVEDLPSGLYFISIKDEKGILLSEEKVSVIK
jgi:Secretion system C-terminal sorting domain